MRFRYTSHLRKRIQQRNLSLNEIEETVTHPDRTRTGYHERRLAQKHFRGKILEVVYKEELEQTVLLTAYWLKEKD